MREDEEDERIKQKVFSIGKWTGIVIIVLILFFGTFYIVSAGERGVVMTFGKPSMDAKGEGLHFKIPLIQSVVIMNVQTQKYEAELSAASSDLQDVKTKIAINYHLLPDTVPEIYRDIGIGYADKVIYPLEQEVNKAATAQFTAEELITKRDAVREQMKQILSEKLAPRGIVVEEISIVNFAFSDSFTAAIEAKVTAQQAALAALNKLEQIKYEAQQTVTKATAEATALQLQKAQVTPELIQLRQIEVQRAAVEKWDGKLPMVTGGAIPFLSLNSLNNSTN